MDAVDVVLNTQHKEDRCVAFDFTLRNAMSGTVNVTGARISMPRVYARRLKDPSPSPLASSAYYMVKLDVNGATVTGPSGTLPARVSTTDQALEALFPLSQTIIAGGVDKFRACIDVGPQDWLRQVDGEARIEVMYNGNKSVERKVPIPEPHPLPHGVMVSP